MLPAYSCECVVPVCMYICVLMCVHICACLCLGVPVRVHVELVFLCAPYVCLSVPMCTPVCACAPVHAHLCGESSDCVRQGPALHLCVPVASLCLWGLHHGPAALPLVCLLTLLSSAPGGPPQPASDGHCGRALHGAPGQVCPPPLPQVSPALPPSMGALCPRALPGPTWGPASLSSLCSGSSLPGLTSPSWTTGMRSCTAWSPAPAPGCRTTLAGAGEGR